MEQPLLERHKQVIRMRQAGHSYTEIARQLGYANASGPRKVVMEAMLPPDTERQDLATAYRNKLLAEYEADRARIESMIEDLLSEPDRPKRATILSQLHKQLVQIRIEEARLTGAYAADKVESTVVVSHEDFLRSCK